MAKDIPSAVREICLSFPEAEEVESRGSPNFRVRGKTFAIYTVNQHGDGKVALWLDAPDGAQMLYTDMDPACYYVPPYVGPKGWLGVELNKTLSWSSIAARVREAYDKVAPASLKNSLGATIEIEPPDIDLHPEEIDPFLKPRLQKIMSQLEKICFALPESSQARQFGNPVWKAGKKTFVATHYTTNRLYLQFWVGAEQQSLLTLDERYKIPAYTGHNGWIDLDVEEYADWQEIEQLVLYSYRHFALKRMLESLDTGDEPGKAGQ